jgi:hypothetical protein
LEGWREWLTPEQLRAIEEHAGECLVRAGYKLSGEHATGVPAALSSAVP